MRQRRNRPRRGGNVLMLLALLLFVFFALAALVIDLGFARLTRRQMQTAADAAALEGLRKRDDPNVPAGGQDAARRLAASNQVALLFDDDLNPANGDPQAFGAGPVVDLTPGVGPAEAFQTVTPGNPLSYKPRQASGAAGLEFNLGNLQYGDMVAGTYDSTASAHVEASDYSRTDFTAADATGAPGAGAFLVRLRRTNDLAGLDGIAGVSSHGPTLPYLFGRGALLAADPPSGYSPRRDGITVRATAIAATSRAMSVGNPFPAANPPPIGVTPFVLDRLALWDSTAFTPSTTVSAAVDASGNITVTTPGFPPGVAGWFAATAPTAVGQAAPPAAAVPAGLALPIAGYVPVTESIANGSGLTPVVRVIGFGRVTMTLTAGTPGQTGLKVQLTKLPGIVAPENASAVLTVPLSLGDDTELANLLAARQNFNDPLLAPALVR